MDAALHLIGTLAQDPHGPARLMRLLEDLQPDALAVEASRGAFEWQSTSGDAASAAAADAVEAKGADEPTAAFWRRRLAKEQLYFEAFTAAGYAARHGRQLHFLQPSAAADGAGDVAAGIRETDLDTLQGIATYDWEDDYARNYARARVDLEAKACLEFLLPVAQHAEYHTRTRAMAGLLERLLQQHRRVAVVCGLTQLYFSEARLTLYAQLYDLVAQRYISDDTGMVRDHPIVLPWKDAT